jgi:hypothetical protein
MRRDDLIDDAVRRIERIRRARLGQEECVAHPSRHVHDDPDGRDQCARANARGQPRARDADA